MSKQSAYISHTMDEKYRCSYCFQEVFLQNQHLIAGNLAQFSMGKSRGITPTTQVPICHITIRGAISTSYLPKNYQHEQLKAKIYNVATPMEEEMQLLHVCMDESILLRSPRLACG